MLYRIAVFWSSTLLFCHPRNDWLLILKLLKSSLQDSDDVISLYLIDRSDCDGVLPLERIKSIGLRAVPGTF